MTLVNRRYKYNIWPIIGIAMVTPIVSCLLLMLIQGVNPAQFSIVTTYWNDEPMYYKQVEGMVHYGIPQGYFGYNEEHSIYGNFGGWTPVNLLPFYLVGKIFGWNHATPVIFNLILWMSVMALVAFYLKPSLKQQLMISMGYIAYTSAGRYILSTTPEAFITVSVVLFVLSFIMFLRNNKTKWLIICDVMMIWLTLLRGFYGIFGLLLMVGLYVNNGKKHIRRQVGIQVILMLIALIGFILMAKYLEAPFFGGDISSDSLFNIKSLVKTALIGMLEAFGYIVEAIKLQSMRGCWYIGYLLITIWTLVKGVNKKNPVYLSISLCLIIILGAMFTIYNAKEGSRQLMALTITGLIFIPFYEEKKAINVVIVAVIGLLFWMNKESFFYHIPSDNEGISNQYVRVQNELTEIIPIEKNTWDNTIIFSRTLNHQDLFAMPAGVGLNCCLDDYIKENINDLTSKYIAVKSNSELNVFLEENKVTQIYKYNDTVIYKFR